MAPGSGLHEQMHEGLRSYHILDMTRIGINTAGLDHDHSFDRCRPGSWNFGLMTHASSPDLQSQGVQILAVYIMFAPSASCKPQRHRMELSMKP